MAMNSVYLSGPITGADAEGICAWRSNTRNLLASGIAIIDPTRQVYDSRTYYNTESEPLELLRRADHGKLVVNRNFSDIKSSSLLLANLVGAQERVSIGTCGEIHWAFSLNIPVVIARERTGNVHDHAMLNAIAMHVSETLDDACEFINQVFLRR